jgi:hypothetical protein
MSKNEIDVSRVVANVMRMYDNDAEPAAILVWEMIRGQYRRFPRLFSAESKIDEGYINVRVGGLCNDGYAPVVRLTMIPDTFHVGRATTMWKKQTITLLVAESLKKKEPTPPPSPFQQLEMVELDLDNLDISYAPSAPVVAEPPPAPVAPPPAPVVAEPPPPAPVVAELTARGTPRTRKAPPLSDEAVRAIRKYAAENNVTNVAIANHFKMSYSVIATIISGRTYKHVK